MKTLEHNHALAHIIGMQTRHAPNRLRRGTVKAIWDDGPDFATATSEVLVEKAPSSRGQRRQRQRDQLAMGRKSRRKAFRNATAERHNEQNLHGMAQVHLLDRGTEAMQDNVSKAVWAFAEKHATIKDIPTDEALDDVEGAMHSLLVQHGDIEP